VVTLCSPTRTKRLLISLAALALVLVVCDVLLGALLIEEGLYKGRRLPPFGTWSGTLEAQRVAGELASPDVDAPVRFNDFHPYLGWSNSPGEYHRKGVKHFNSIGARGSREYAPVAPEGVQRIACFGESFTFGSDMKDGDDWPAQLDPQVEAIDMGVGGYGTDQALLRFRREGTNLSAHTVAIGLMLEHIGRNVNRDRKVFYPQTVKVKPRFVLEGNDLRLLPLPFETRRAAIQAAVDGSIRELLSEGEYWAGDDPLVPFSNIARILACNRAWARRDTAELWRDPEGEPFRVTLAILETFCREALASGAQRAVVLIFPAKQDLLHLASTGVPYWRARTGCPGATQNSLSRPVPGPAAVRT
jgi:hypothetical protein